MNPSSLADILEYDKEGLTQEVEWIDAAGLLCTKERLHEVISGIEKGELDTFEKVHTAFETVYTSYEADEWNWFLNTYKTLKGNELSKEPKEQIESFLTEWKDASVKIYNMVLTDAEKEFDDSVKIGFGIDGNREEDFKAVRGEFEDNSFVKNIRGLIGEVEENYTSIVSLL